jgi:hypothetical protein
MDERVNNTWWASMLLATALHGHGGHFLFTMARWRCGSEDRQHWVRTKKEKVGPKPGLEKSKVHTTFCRDRSIGVCFMRHEK